jgi:hypothetical protein
MFTFSSEQTGSGMGSITPSANGDLHFSLHKFFIQLIV